MALLQGIQGAGNVQEKVFGGNSFSPLPAGGYVCKILEVGIDKTHGGSQYIKLRFDVTEGEFAGYFQKRFTADASSQYGQKWKGVYKIFLPHFNGDNDKYMEQIATYKGNINLIARCNNLPEPDVERGYDPDIFKGCTIGILFRDADFKGNAFTEPAFLHDASKVRSGEYEIPKPRTSSQNSSTGFYNVQPAVQQNGGSVFSAANAFQAQTQYQQPANAQPAVQPQGGTDFSEFEQVSGPVPF